MQESCYCYNISECAYRHDNLPLLSATLNKDSVLVSMLSLLRLSPYLAAGAW